MTFIQLPFYAAVLAQICHVELQLGSDTFYTQLLQAEMFEKSLTGIKKTFAVSLFFSPLCLKNAWMCLTCHLAYWDTLCWAVHMCIEDRFQSTVS